MRTVVDTVLARVMSLRARRIARPSHWQRRASLEPLLVEIECGSPAALENLGLCVQAGEFVLEIELRSGELALIVILVGLAGAGHGVRAGRAGATVLHGVMGFGASSRVHAAKLLAISTDLPVVIEIVDDAKKIDALLPFLDETVQEGLMTIEAVRVLKCLADGDAPRE